jgi:hypothetical protein
VSTSHAFVSVRATPSGHAHHVEEEKEEEQTNKRKREGKGSRRRRKRRRRTVQRTVHSPELDRAIVGARNDEGQRGVEGGPVNAPVVALEHVLDHHVGVAEKIVLCETERVVKSSRGRNVLFLQTCGRKGREREREIRIERKV